MTHQRRAARWLCSLAFLLFVPFLAGPAHANPEAEAFVSANIQKGLTILNDQALSPEQRAEQFQRLLLGITDLKRIALFTLGQYAKTASPEDEDAFAAAFQDYSIGIYRSYLGTYAGQTLKVTGSIDRSPTDFVVATQMVEPNQGNGRLPLEIDFRVRTDAGKPQVTDLGIAGMWLAVEERDQFGAFLAQNHGDVRSLAAHLHDVAKAY